MSTKRWTAEQAQRELRGWERSGLSLSRYAARRGYQAQRLSWWKERLQGKRVPVTPVTLAPAVVTGTDGHGVSVWLSTDGTVRVEVVDAACVHPEWVGELLRSLRREA